MPPDSVNWTFRTAASQPLSLDTEPAADSVDLLSEDATTPGSDGLVLMLLLMEKAGQHSMGSAETRIANTREVLKNQLDEYLEQLQEALRRAREAEKDSGGWFSDLLGSVVGILGKVLGPLLEHGIEMIKFPAEAAISIGKSIANNQNLMDGLERTALKLIEEGDISADIQGFSEGVARFAADLTEFIGKLHVAVARAALTGEDLGGLIEKDVEGLKNSIETNIIDNPHFWAVSRVVAQGAAIAAVVCTGGAATPLVIAGAALMAVSELDRQTGFIEKVVGEKAAPWVRIGIQVIQTACLAMAGGSPDQTIELLQKLTTALEGGRGVYLGVRTLVEAHRRGDAIDAEADRLQTLQRMQRLQRLLEVLLESLEEDSEDHTRSRELGTDLVATRAATERALIPA